MNVVKQYWPLLTLPILIALMGVITMNPFDGGSSLASRQLIWITLGTIMFIVMANIDMRFIRRTPLIISGYVLAVALLALLLVVGRSILGAKSWFDLGYFAFQPSDFAKVVCIALLAKYFSRRHMEIGYIFHIILSGLYVGLVALLVLVQPALGTAIVIFTIWFGMILVSGIPIRHLAVVFIVGAVAGTGLFLFGLKPHQQDRILTFVNPTADIYGIGYNSYQATIAAGSGQLWGKGVGFGTQSKLRFLPEYQTDFILAAYAEEWGFAGVVLLFALYALLLFQLIMIARKSATNFDALFTLGVVILLFSHIAIHSGVNLGLIPVTGTTIPFMSSGGSHVVMEFGALGVVASLARQGRSVPRDRATQEYEG
jgi:rod shape determining protein RodA